MLSAEFMNQGLTKAFKHFPLISFASIPYRILNANKHKKREFIATFLGKFSAAYFSVETNKVFNALLNVKL